MGYSVEIEDGTIKIEVRETDPMQIREFESVTLPLELSDFTIRIELHAVEVDSFFLDSLAIWLKRGYAIQIIAMTKIAQQRLAAWKTIMPRLEFECAF